MNKSKLSSLALFNKSIKYTIYMPLVVATSAVLSACGGSSDDSSDVSPTTTGFSLAVSDAPVDSASEVVVVFDEVELTGDGAPIRFDVQDENGDPRSIDLLTLPGSQFETIVAETANDIARRGVESNAKRTTKLGRITITYTSELLHSAGSRM